MHQVRRPGEPMAIPSMLQLFLSIPEEQFTTPPARNGRDFSRLLKVFGGKTCDFNTVILKLKVSKSTASGMLKSCKDAGFATVVQVSKGGKKTYLIKEAK
jgi:hypothetical protein